MGNIALGDVDIHFLFLVLRESAIINVFLSAYCCLFCCTRKILLLENNSLQ